MKPILCIASALILCCAAYAQQPSAPPIKMGLWETTTTTNIKLNLPPEVLQQLQGKSLPGMGPTTMKMQVCMTPETWRESYAKSQKNQNCEMKNLKQDATSMSADVVCTQGKGTTTGHLQVNFQSMERSQGTMHMEVTDGRSSQPTIMDMTFDSIFKGADCQGIAPGQGKLVR